MKNLDKCFITICHLLSMSVLANNYDLCKDILRDGIRDKIISNRSINSKTAAHYEFCSLAKEFDLSEKNFHIFANRYLETLSSIDNQTGGDLNIGLGLFSGSTNFQKHNSSQNINRNNAQTFLTKNSKSILNYYNNQCEKWDYNDSLQAESITHSKIASISTVNAWRECMLNQSGFFAYLIQTSPNDDNEDMTEYDIVVSWKSNEGTEITSLYMRYLGDRVGSPYEELKENNGFVRTTDQCTNKYGLKNGSTIPFSIIHKNRDKNATVRILAKTNTQSFRSQLLIIPKRITIKKARDELSEDIPPNQPSFTMESYCEENLCSEYMKNILVEKYEISSEFVRSISGLDRGACKKCSGDHAVRFCFDNCNYKTKVQVAKTGTIIESNIKILTERESITTRIKKDGIFTQGSGSSPILSMVIFSQKGH